jgi:hypothetical protein
MNNEEYKQKLEDDNEKPLYKNYRKYHHIARMGHEEVSGLLDGKNVVVQTKLDGANLSVFWDEEDGLMIASRNHLIYRQNQTGVINAFSGAVDYILDHQGIINFVTGTGNILRGEFLVKHSIRYADQFWKKFYAFDVEDRDGKLLNFIDMIPVLEAYKILYIKPLLVTNNPSLESLIELTKGSDEYGAEQKEGVVIKRYDFQNQFGRTQFGKIVVENFKEKNKLAFGATKHDSDELKFVANYITREFVKKTIFTVADNKGEYPSIKHMREVLGRVYYDIFREEFWDFLHKERVGNFNFKTLQKLCTEQTKSYALDFYNGVTTVHDRDEVVSVEKPISAKVENEVPNVG